jgi:acyl-CoA thioesterase
MGSKTTHIVDKMFLNDPFSQWLGIERINETTGNVSLKMTIREEMLNGFGIAHGGITYSLADSALAFSANSHGIQSVSIETSISHTKALKKGDIITTQVEEINLTTKTGIYQIKILNQKLELVALFKGTVYRTGKEWEV